MPPSPRVGGHQAAFRTGTAKEPNWEAGTGQEPGMVSTSHGQDLAPAARGIRYTSTRSHSPHGHPRILYTPADHGRSWVLRNPTLEGPALDPAEICICKAPWVGRELLAGRRSPTPRRDGPLDPRGHRIPGGWPASTAAWGAGRGVVVPRGRRRRS